MARPKKSDEERIEDFFFDLDLDDQIRMMTKTFPMLHRLKRRTVSTEDNGAEESASQGEK